jgi:hypothetical protein
MMKIEESGSASGSGSISQGHGSADLDPDPDPHQNVMDPRNTGPENRAGSCYTSMLQIEPHSNGPLFVELHALLRIRREEQQLATWQPNNPSKPSGTASVVGRSALLRIRREEQQLATWQPNNNNPSKPSGTASGSSPQDPDPGGQNGSPKTPANHQVQSQCCGWIRPAGSGSKRAKNEPQN